MGNQFSDCFFCFNSKNLGRQANSRHLMEKSTSEILNRNISDEFSLEHSVNIPSMNKNNPIVF